MKLPEVEAVAEQVHEDWRRKKIADGCVSRKSTGGHELMMPWGALDESAKEEYRNLVRTVYAAIGAAQAAGEE